MSNTPPPPPITIAAIIPIITAFLPDDDLLFKLHQIKSIVGLLAQLKRDNVIGRRDAAKSLVNHIDNS